MLEGLEDRAVPAVLSAFLTTEHVDLNVSYTGGANGTWSLQPRDADHAVAYSPEDALLYVGDNAQSRVARPSDPAFDFIGVAAGEPFYRAPQNQNPELIYLGVAGYGVTPSLLDRYNPLAESKGRVSGTGAWVKVSLVDVKHFTPEGQPGQGQFSVWQSGENGPNVLMSTVNDGVSNPNSAGLDTTDGIGSDDALWIIAGGHIHYNWGFSEKGRYEVEFKLSGYLNDGNTTELGQAVESEPIKLYFSVGSVGELEFDASSYTVNESAGTASLTVRRVGGSDGRISVEYATSDGTATAGSDYSETKGVLTFNDQETVKTITIPIINDTLVEGDETVQLTLTKPAPNSINGYLIDFESDDNGLLGSQTTATLTILDDDTTSNSPPTLSDIADQTILEDAATGAIAFIVGDAQTAPGDLIVTAVSSNGTLVPVDGIVLGGSGANRTITIRPAANQSGSTTITLTVTDASGLTATDTFVLTVTPVNDAPVANPLSVVTDKDMAKAITLSGVDIEDDPLTYVIVDGPTHGTLTGTGANLTYTPNPGYQGSDSFTYKVNDGSLDSPIATVSITVGRVNALPTISSISDVVMDEDGDVTIAFTVNDLETAANALIVTRASSNTTLLPVGRVTLGGSGASRTLRIRPNPNQFGDGTVTLTVRDGDGATSSISFKVTVNPVNDPPIATDDSVFVLTDATTILPDLLANDRTLDEGQTFVLASFGSGAHGIVADAGGGRLSYTANPGFRGFDSFTYTIVDNKGATATATVTVSVGVVDLVHTDLYVNYVNGEWYSNIKADYSPQQQVDSDEAVLFANPSTRLVLPALPPSYSFMGASEGDEIWLLPQVQAISSLWLGFSNEGTNPADLASSIRLDLVSFSGPGHFSLYDTDSFGNPRAWMDTVDGVNSADDAAVGGNSADFYTLIANGHSHLNWTFTEPGRYVIGLRPTALVNRTDADGNPIKVTSTGPLVLYTIDVDTLSDLPLVENPPLARNDAANTIVGSGPVTIAVLANDSPAPDPAETLAVTGVTQGAHGEVTIADDGKSVIYTPAEDFSGIDTFTYTVTDEHGGVATATVNVTVDAAPIISSITDQFVVENGSTGPISFTVGDALTPAADLLVTVTSSNSALVPNGNIVLGGSDADRTLAITPIAGQVGSTTITITVTDAAGLQTSEAFVLTVTANRLVPFAMPTYHGGALTSYAWNSVAADFNGDGYVDLVTSSGSIPLVYYQGAGDGRFLPEQSLNAGLGLSAEGIATVDYDGDGDADLLAIELNEATSDRTISLYRNDGTGQFTRVVLKSGLRSGYTLEVGDFNEDGRPDVAYNTSLYDPATNTQTLAFNYALQQPTGELGPETTLWTANGYGDLAVGDVNGDGHLDIVGAETIYAPDFSSSTNRLLIFPGNGDGTFGSPQAITTGASPAVQQIVDVNGDGRLDLVVSDRVGDSRAGYYPQQADGSLGARVGLLPGIGQLNALRVADINGDGVPDLVSDTYSGDYGSLSVSWSPGLGGGAFGAAILIAPNDSNMTSFQVADLDGDSYPDIVATSYASGSLKQPVRVFLNKTGEDPMVLLPPAARGYVAGDPIDLQVYFGFPITVNGTPRIALRVGENLVYADYVGGSGTPTLRFRYTVSSTDVDLDGVQLASNVIDLNGGTLKNPINGDAVLEFPNLTFNGVVVNGAGPLVQMISRLDATPTEAGTVRFTVQFAEDVTGVDVTDFAVRMNAGDLAGAAVLSVTGSGGLYEVTVSTGTGSGTLGLSVLGTASIYDLDGSILGKGYEGGQVYTVRTTPLGDIDKLYTDGHADYRPVYEDGEFSYVLNDGESAIPSDEVITYFDSTALVNRPESGTYDFLGVGPGEQYYLSNSNGSVATVPYLGWSGESLARGSFATYRPDDPRITSNTPQGYLKVQLVGMRSSSGGDFSLYSIANESPRVWMATSDGISDTDNIWLYPGTHLHRNTAFSKPGTYEIDIVVSGFLDSNGNGVYDPIVDTYVESGIQTMVFHVDTLGARDDAYMVHGRNPLHGSVTMNDEWHDALGDMTASVVTTTTKGSLVLQPNGSFSYVPSEAFDGTDSFVYQLTNSRGGLTTATVIITAAGPRDFEAIVTEGHTDVGIGYEDEAWDLHVHDEEHDAEYEPGKALLYVGPQALTSRTGGLAGPAFDFLGAAAGETFYSLPQTPNPELLFLGIGAEELGTGVFSGDEVTLRLKAVNGPGHFSLWQSGDLGPTVAMATSDGITLADQAVIQAGSHGHYHWSFTARGRYEVTFEAFATLPDGTAVASGDVTYYFSVDSLGQIQLDSPTYSVSEDGVVTITVLRTGGSDGPLTVEYAAVGGTATSGVDFASFGGTLTFLDGETEKTFTIVSLPDTIAEGDETVIVSLFAPEGSPTRLGSPSDAILTIVDDDPPIPADGVISGYVFIDSLNYNGLRDPGEAGVAGVRLTLTGFDDLGPIEPRSVVTGADGSYRFEGLRPGTYHVAEEQPDGLLDGKDSRGPSHVLDGSQRTDVIDGVTLAPSEQVEAINFGELQPGRIGGSVFEDVDGNGLRRNGEQGIAGVVITLTGTDDLGAITPRTIQTSADGTYVFDGLRPGVYTITEIQPDGFHDGWDTRDNLVVLPGSAGVDTIPVTLSPGQSLVENHFGEVRRTKGDDSVSEPATTVIARVVNRRTIALFFNSPLDAAQASTLAHYRLSAVGQFGQSVSRGIRTVPLRVASYNPEFHFVRLAIPPRMRLRNNLTYQLDVNRRVALNPSAGLVSEDGTLGDYSVRFTRGRSVTAFDVDGDRARFTTRSRNVLELHGTSSGAASRLYVQPAPRQSVGQLEASVTPGLASDGLFNLPLLDGVERFRSNPAGRLTIGQVVPRGPIPPRIR